MDEPGAAAAPRRRERNQRGQGGRLRDELIAAARELLSSADAESGLTIRGVTRAAGVHPQAFYLQFGSLDELLYAVYAVEFAQLSSALAAAAGRAGAGEPALRAMAQEYARFALSQPARYRLLMSVPGQEHPGWQELPGSQALGLLQAALAEAGRPDPATRAVLLWASLHGLVSLRVSRPAFPWPPLPELVDLSVDAVLALPG